MWGLHTISRGCWLLECQTVGRRELREKNVNKFQSHVQWFAHDSTIWKHNKVWVCVCTQKILDFLFGYWTDFRWALYLDMYIFHWYSRLPVKVTYYVCSLSFMRILNFSSRQDFFACAFWIDFPRASIVFHSLFNNFLFSLVFALNKDFFCL